MLGKYFNIQSGNSSAIAVWPQRRKIDLPVNRAAATGADQLVQFARDHAGPEDHAQPLGIDRLLPQAGVGAGQIGRREGQLDVAAHHLQALPRPDVLLGVEIGHLAPNRRRSGRVDRHVKPPDAAAALAEGRPERLLPDADRADHADAGDDDCSIGRHIRYRNVIGGRNQRPLAMVWQLTTEAGSRRIHRA